MPSADALQHALHEPQKVSGEQGGGQDSSAKTRLHVAFQAEQVAGFTLQLIIDIGALGLSVQPWLRS